MQDVEPEGPKVFCLKSWKTQIQNIPSSKVAVTINMGRPDPGGEDNVDEQQEVKRLETERRVGFVRKDTMMADPLQSYAMPNPLFGSQQEVALEAGDLVRWIFACHL